MKREFGVHWLAFLGTTKTGDGKKLMEAARSAAVVGTLFELACDPVNGMSAMETAAALNDAGMKRASYCRFFPDKWCGDPLADDNTEALNVIKKDLGFIDILSSQGIEVPYLTGPSCFVLEKEYDSTRQTLHNRTYEWYRRVGDLLSERKLTVCIEYLRPSEDKNVLGSMEVLCGLIDRLGDPRFKIHGDIFHMLERKEDPHHTLTMAGNRLGYLHAHGTMRLPPGWYNFPTLGSTDYVNWHLVGKALDHINYQGPVIPEPFGQEIRDAIPALGEGLPPAINPELYYAHAREHLQKNGVL